MTSRAHDRWIGTWMGKPQHFPWSLQFPFVNSSDESLSPSPLLVGRTKIGDHLSRSLKDATTQEIPRQLSGQFELAWTLEVISFNVFNFFVNKHHLYIPQALNSSVWPEEIGSRTGKQRSWQSFQKMRGRTKEESTISICPSPCRISQVTCMFPSICTSHQLFSNW